MKRKVVITFHNQEVESLTILCTRWEHRPSAKVFLLETDTEEGDILKIIIPEEGVLMFDDQGRVE